MQQIFSQSEIVTQLSDFFKSPYTKVCFFEGKTGYFKTFCINETLESNKNVLSFKLKCFESTTLDDIFLMLLNSLKSYAEQKKISVKKIETDKISQRINDYLVNIDKESVIVIDSFQNVLNNKNEKDKEEIINFILHVAAMKNYKVVLVSNAFTKELESEFGEKNLGIAKIEMPPLSLQQFKECFAADNKVFDINDVEQLYETTKGSPICLFVTLNILSWLNIDLKLFFDEYLTKRIPFENFLINKLLTFVPKSAKSPLNLLAVFNGGLSEACLVQKNIFSKEQISYLLEKGVLAKEYGLIFVKSYVKKHILKGLSNFDKNKLHSYWREFYISQIPLKPAQRAVLISRNTMRSQIEYHSSNILQKNETKKDSPNMSLISYLNSDMTSWNYKNTNVQDIESEEKSESKKKRPEPPESIKNKNNGRSLEKYELTKEELILMSNPVELNQKTEKTLLSRTREQREDNEIFNDEIDKEKKQDIVSTYNLAQSMEDVHNFETAATFYLRALDMKYESEYAQYHSKILERLAYCCEKMNRTTDAIDFYNSLIELYAEKQDIENVNYTRLSIADLYKKTYKYNHARVIYENFIKNKNANTPAIVFQSYIELADIEAASASSEKAIEYYKEAFKIDFGEMNPKIKEKLSRAYFRYASILDEFNETEKAIEYYKKCIEISDTNDSNVSTSYTNLAEIMRDKNDVLTAIDYYKKALKTDFEISNYEGIYYISLRLAIIYEDTDKNLSIKWLIRSLKAAKRTKDSILIANAYNETGAYYEHENDLKQALKAYLNAQLVLKSCENEIEKKYYEDNINQKILDIKNKITEDAFEKITGEVLKNE